MFYTDIHCHLLYGVDDGAKTKEDMFAMLDASYQDGVRNLCATPHYHPGYYGENENDALKAFSELKEYAADKYPDMRLFLGNELHYRRGAVQWIKDGTCKTINNTDYLLMDFVENETRENILSALSSVLSVGYIPVLAHAERYTSLYGKIKDLKAISMDGVFIQISAGSLLGEFGLRCKMQAKKLVDQCIADLVSSDAHGLHHRVTHMNECYNYLLDKYGEDAADTLCRLTADRILGISKEKE